MTPLRLPTASEERRRIALALSVLQHRHWCEHNARDIAHVIAALCGQSITEILRAREDEQ